MYLGSWKIDDYLTFPVNTHKFDTGVATDGDAVPTYRVYEDETATPILTGSMAKLDDANTTGFYTERIQLTAASGLEKGKCYTIYISATVNSITGTVSHTFQIEAEVDMNTNSGISLPTNFSSLGIEADGDLTKVNTLDGHTAQTGDSYGHVNHTDYGNAKLVRAVTPATQLNTGNANTLSSHDPGATLGTSTVTVANLNTACDTVTVTSMAADVLTASALKADAVTEIQSGLSTHDAAAVKTAMEAAGSKLTLTLEDTNELQTNQGNWATATGFATSAKQDTMETTLNDVPTTAEFEARTLPSADYVVVGDTIAGVTICTTCTTNTDMRGTNGASTHDAAGVKTAIETDGSKLDHLWEMTEDDAGVRRYTTNALEQAPSGTGGDATEANQTTIINSLTDVKGTGFVKDTHSLPQCITGEGGVAGPGAISWPITVNDNVGNPIDNVGVWVSTDISGNNVIAGTLYTNASGIVTFMLDAGDYYHWREKGGWNFTNPESFTVS